MSVRKVLIGFVPWVIFSLVATRAGPDAIGVAASLAFLVALGLVIRSVRRGESAKLLEVTAVVVFAGFAGVSLITSAGDDFLVDYGRALAALVLAVVIFVLLPVLPFTEQYARESVPREYWHTPRFRAVNRRISAVWGGVVAAMAVSHAVAGAVAVPDPGVRLLHRPVDLVFNWVIPGLLVWLAVTVTARVSAAASDPSRTGPLRTPTRHADSAP
jgi:hypothetical protein